MDSDKTPNILCREQTFFMNILKPCFTIREDDSTSDMTTPVLNATPPEAHEAQSADNTSSKQTTPVGELNPVTNKTEKTSSSSSMITDSAPNTTLFKSFASMQSCIFFFMECPGLSELLESMLTCFSTTTELFTHSVGSLTGSRTSISTSLLTSSWNVSCRCRGTFQGLCLAGVESGLSLSL